METAHLSAYLGDSAVLEIPLTWDGEEFDPGNDWALIFTAKIKASDADADAVIQKATGSGITSSAGLASVALVPQDTVDLIVRNLVCDVQAQHTTTGAVRTVGYARLSLLRDITRETETSIPVITTEEPSPLYGAVRFDASQSLTSPQKAQARTNIGAITGSEITNSNVNAAISTDASATRTALGLGTAATKDTSLGGFGVADSGKVVSFGSQGNIYATATSTQAVSGLSQDGYGVAGLSVNSTALLARTEGGDYHAEFGGLFGVGSKIDATRGWFVWLYNSFLGTLKTADITANRTWTLPDTTGTIALSEQTQATLVSGTNIKTVNGSSLLGSGNLSITSDLTSGPVTSSAGVSTIADSALSIAKTSGLQTALDAKRTKATERVFIPEDYGAIGDTREVVGTVSITSGQAVLTVTGGNFTSADVGKLIAVPGAGSAAGYLYTTISAYTSATQVTLAANASTTVSAVATSVNVATDDRVALQATVTAAEAAGGGTIKLSRCYSLSGASVTGHGVTAGIVVRKGWLKFEGITDGNSFPKDAQQNKDVPQSGLRLHTASMIGIYLIGTLNEAMHGLTFRDFTIQGDYDTAYLFQSKRGIVAFPSTEGAKYPDCLLFDRMNFQWLNECVALYACDSPTITNSRVCDSYKGIFLSGCIGAMISHNVIWDEMVHGVRVEGSTTSYNSPIITGNAFGRSGWDIIIAGSDVNPTITGNGFRGGSPGPILTQNGAIQLSGTNSNATSTISGNTFTSTGYGNDTVASQGYRTATIDIATGVQNVAITGNSFNLISTTLPAVKVTGGTGISLVGNSFTMQTRIPATFDATSKRSRIAGNVHSGTITNSGTNTDIPNQGPQVFSDSLFIAKNLPTYADNATALAAYAPIGSFYRTSTGELRVVYDSDNREVDDYIRTLASYGVTVSGAQRTLLQNFVDAEKTATRWTSHTRIHIFGWGNAQANALDLKTGKAGNFVGTVTHATGYSYADGSTGYFDLGINAFRDFGTTSQSLGALVYIKHSTASDSALISGGGNAASSLQLLDIGSNVGWYPAGNTNQTRSDAGGIYLGSRTSGSSKLHLRNTAGFTSSSAGSPIAPTPSLDETNMYVWRRGVPDFYSNARIGVVYAGLYLDDSACSSFTANLKTLWEGLFGLTLP